MRVCGVEGGGPSSPLASVEPVLGIPGPREAVYYATAPVVATSLIVSSVPIGDEGGAQRARGRAALLESRGVAANPVEVAPAIERLGLDTAVVATLLRRDEDHPELPQAICEPADVGGRP